MNDAVAPRLGWRRPWYGVPLAVLLAVVLALLRYGNPALLETLRFAGFDTYQRLVPRELGDAFPVVIVTIDDRSLAELGQWPWPRWRVAALVEHILAAKPAALAIDILFAGADRVSPERVAAEMPGLTAAARAALYQLPSNDERLGEAIARGPVSIAVAGISGEAGAPAPFRTPTRLIGTDPGERLIAFPARIASQEVIRNGARGEGLVNVPPERDNIVRRVPAVARIGERLVPLLAVDAVRLAEGAPAFDVLAGRRGVRAVRAGGLEIPTLPDGRLWPRLSPSHSGRFLSAADVFRSDEVAPLMAGRIVILGSTAATLGDFHATAVAPRMAGPEIQAQVIEAALSGDLLRRPARVHVVEAVIVGFAALLIALVLPYRRPLVAVGLLIAAMAVVVLAGFAAFLAFGLLVDTLTPVAASAAVFGQMLAAQLVTTDRERRRVAEALQQEREATARQQGELAAARQIQMGMLPQTFPSHPQIEIHARLEPARAVGGDFYDVAELSDGRIYFAVGDVSGKGVPAALFMALAKALARAGARRAIPVQAMVSAANAELASENPASMFVTLLAGIIDPTTGEAVLVNAGHDVPMRLARGRAPEPIDQDGGPPLCVLDSYDYPAVALRLEPGETLLMITDGVLDALSPAGETYGAARLRNLADRLAGLPAKAAVDAIFDDVARFASGAEPADDMSVLAIRRLAASGQ